MMDFYCSLIILLTILTSAYQAEDIETSTINLLTSLSPKEQDGKSTEQVGDTEEETYPDRIETETTERKALDEALSAILNNSSIIIEDAEYNYPKDTGVIIDEKNPTVKELKRFMEKYDELSLDVCIKFQAALWDYVTNMEQMTKKNVVLKNLMEAASREDEVKRRYWDEMKAKFLPLDRFGKEGRALRNTVRMIRERGTNVLMPQSKQREEIDLMQQIWNTARVCPYGKDNCNLDRVGEPMNVVVSKMKRVRDYKELTYYWSSWRDASGRKSRNAFREYVNRVNDAAIAAGFRDAGAVWRYAYDDRMAENESRIAENKTKIAQTNFEIAENISEMAQTESTTEDHRNQKSSRLIHEMADHDDSFRLDQPNSGENKDNHHHMNENEDIYAEGIEITRDEDYNNTNGIINITINNSEVNSTFANSSATNNKTENGDDELMQFDENFSDMVDRLWMEVKPLYDLLRRFVSRKLRKFYGSEFSVKEEDSLPEHILGNLFGQEWQNIYDIVAPFKSLTQTNLKESMESKNWTVHTMFEVVDDFYKSMGLLAMDEAYGNSSVLGRPERKMRCSPSSHDMCDGVNYRVTMCAELDEDNLKVAARLLGHVQYFMQYKDQPVVLRDGPNPAFHDALSAVVARQVLSPAHTHRMGLTALLEDSSQLSVSRLLQRALEELPRAGYAAALDRWRWDVFVEPHMEDMNKHYWDLRMKYTNIEPPTTRNESDLDPAAKYHVVSHVQYITYFVSCFLEYQILSGLCVAAGEFDPNATFVKPLEKCNLYGSRVAGDKISAAMKLGASKDWRTVLHLLTGETSLSSTPLLQYFSPLQTFLEADEAKYGKLRKDMDRSAPIGVGIVLVFLTLIIVGIYVVKKKKMSRRVIAALRLGKKGSLDIAKKTVSNGSGRVNVGLDVSEERL